MHAHHTPKDLFAREPRLVDVVDEGDLQYERGGGLELVEGVLVRQGRGAQGLEEPVHVAIVDHAKVVEVVTDLLELEDAQGVDLVENEHHLPHLQGPLLLVTQLLPKLQVLVDVLACA